MIIDNRKADQPASQSAKKEKILQDDYNTKISPVKEEDYYIQVPISVHNEGIRALATLANITAIIALEEDSYGICEITFSNGRDRVYTGKWRCSRIR